MRQPGTVVRWDATRGFGFIRSQTASADIFFHKQDFRDAATPREGLAVTFEEIHVGGKGLRAMAVQAAAHAVHVPRAGPLNTTRARRPQQRPTRRSSAPAAAAPAGLALLLMLAWAALIAWGVWAGRLTVIALPIALLLNLATFFAYWLDKYAAQQGRWRIAENTLHLLSVLGGWPGAWIAQQVLRHKSRKPSFRAAYRATVVLHCSVLAGVLFRQMLPRLLAIT